MAATRDQRNKPGRAAFIENRRNGGVKGRFRQSPLCGQTVTLRASRVHNPAIREI